MENQKINEFQLENDLTHLKSIGDITDKLMKLQKNKKELTDDDVKKEITNNNVFVGSTTELQRLLLQKDDNIIDAKPED